MYEIDKLAQMLNEADIPFERCIDGPFIYIYYPGKEKLDRYGYTPYFIEKGGGHVFAYKNRNDTLLYRGYITQPDWTTQDEDMGTGLVIARNENQNEFTAEEVFPLWWADWTCRQEKMLEKQKEVELT